MFNKTTGDIMDYFTYFNSERLLSNRVRLKNNHRLIFPYRENVEGKPLLEPINLSVPKGLLKKVVAGFPVS